MSTTIDPEVFLTLFPPDERDVVRKLLISPSSRNSESRLDRLIASIPESIAAKLAPSSGKISAEPHNKMVTEIQQDLLGLFQIYGELDQAIASHDRKSRSLIGEIASRLDTLEERVAQVERWARQPNGEGVPISISYRRPKTLPSGAEDPETGYAVGPQDLLHQDLLNGEATLPLASEVDRILSSQGGHTASLIWIDQRGGLPIEGQLHLDRALDGRNETAWWARHISTTPVRDPEATGLDEGVSATIDLRFESAGPLSEIFLSPFGPMGVEIMRVECYARDTDSHPVAVWVGKDGDKPPFTARRPVRISGKGESIQRVRFVIGQRHARLRRLLPEELEDRESTIPLQPSLRDWAESRGLVVESNGTSEQPRHQLVYEYLYGIREIKALSRTYRPRGVTLSEPIRPVRPLDQVSVEIEHEPIPSQGAPLSSIRCYLSVQGRKIPILPRRINGEPNLWARGIPLVFSGLGIAELPFPADTSRVAEFSLFEDGERVPNSLITVSENLVAYLPFKPDSIYWATYPVPDDPSVNGTVIDMTQLGLSAITRVERFQPSFHRSGSGGRVVKLSRVPYIDFKQVVQPGFDPNGAYRPIEVYLIGSFEGTSKTRIGFQDPLEPEAPYVSNETDYLSGTRKLLLPYSSNRKIYSFRQEGDKIIFGDELPDVAIEVHYRTLVEEIRLTAVVERGIGASASETPRLTEIRIHPRYAGSISS